MINDLKNEIDSVKNLFFKEVERVKSLEHLQVLSEKFTSRKRGVLTNLLKGLKGFDKEQKPLAGKLVNILKVQIENELSTLEDSLNKKNEVRVDASLPELPTHLGRTHLLSYVRNEVEDIFIGMGYDIADGPEIEQEYYNFTALNFLEHHPARDEQDTFFIKNFDDMVLRTHTSPVQVRYMQKNKPPIKVIAPGRVFRKDEVDATHSPVFNQIEGLLVAKDINFSHLKGTLGYFLKSFFGETVDVRFRPSFFPFTEPSAEVDVSCFLCNGEDSECKICKGTGWIEILGSGMVHPEVLKNGNIDPDEYSGFAFGMGIERITMLKYGIHDLRMFYGNDIRFLSQFG